MPSKWFPIIADYALLLFTFLPMLGYEIYAFCIITSGPGSSVGIATGYGLDGPGIESRWGETFRRPDRPWGPPSLLYNGYRAFPGGRKRPGRDADLSSPPSAEI